MAKSAVRLQVVQVGVFTALALLAVRAAQVQLLEGRRWAEEAQAQRTERIVLHARRGTLSDRHGTPLALTQEMYHVGVAPNELRDPGGDGAVIARQLGLSATAGQQALRKRYAYFAGPFSALEVQPLRSVRGVHLEPVVNRFYPALELARTTIGRVAEDGYGASGLEKTLDSLLAGRPGSAAKIFAAAALLSLKRVRPGEHVSGEDGTYRLPGRTITDEDPQPTLTLADAIRVSSKIAIVKFATRLTPAEQYGMLRDFGFGALTGIEFPGEAAGRLRPPSEWTRPSAASLAIGYELSVTPIQVAAAYAALANGGLLLQPTLIREVRSPEGRVLYRHEPEPVRRAVSPAIAAALRDLLRGVVEHGTGSEAALTTFPVAAKTGTARRVVNGHYAPGQYTASFAALFPADKPQLVLVVKIDNPHKGSYFAAQTAAPVTRSMLEQALAARTVALDRARLSIATPPTAAVPLEDDGGVVPYVVPWPYQPDSVGAGRRQTVPDVTGLRLREAVRALHRRGFRVRLKGWGTAEHTWPAAGDSAATGATVTLFAQAVPPRSAAISAVTRRRPKR